MHNLTADGKIEKRFHDNDAWWYVSFSWTRKTDAKPNSLLLIVTDPWNNFGKWANKNEYTTNKDGKIYGRFYVACYTFISRLYVHYNFKIVLIKNGKSFITDERKKTIERLMATVSRAVWVRCTHKHTDTDNHNRLAVNVFFFSILCYKLYHCSLPCKGYCTRTKIIYEITFILHDFALTKHQSLSDCVAVCSPPKLTTTKNLRVYRINDEGVHLNGTWKNKRMAINEKSVPNQIQINGDFWNVTTENNKKALKMWKNCDPRIFHFDRFNKFE